MVVIHVARIIAGMGYVVCDLCGTDAPVIIYRKIGNTVPIFLILLNNKTADLSI
jgi:hypothetical protein